MQVYGILQKLHKEKTTVTHNITPTDFWSGTIGLCKKHTNTFFFFFTLPLCSLCVVFLKRSRTLALYALKSLCWSEESNIHLGWHEGLMSKWENLNFWVEYTFNEPDVMQRPEIYSRQNIRNCIELKMSDIELKRTILTFWKINTFFVLSNAPGCNSSSFNCLFGAFRVVFLQQILIYIYIFFYNYLD